MNESLRRVAVLADFDGTITPVDLSDFIYREFTSCGLYYSQLWQQQVIGTREEIQLSFAHLTANPDVIAAALAMIPVDPTFHQIVSFARKNGLEIAVVSDGLDWAIQTVLEANGIQGLPIYANHVFIQEDKFGFEFPWFDPVTPLVGVGKTRIVRQYQQNGGKVAFIGDGRTDQEAAREADLVFAKDCLLEYCRMQGIPALEFRDFYGICAEISRWLESLYLRPIAD